VKPTDGKADADQDLDPDGPARDRALPSYFAVRTANYLFVDYYIEGSEPPASGTDPRLDIEFFDLDDDPYETVNIARTSALTDAQVVALRHYVADYANCADDTCRTVDSNPPVIP
jgi:hypothetical protein